MSKHEQLEYSVGIVGYQGFVGGAMHHLFPEAKLFDIAQGSSFHKPGKEEINKCSIVFVAVPTDAKEDGSVDLSAIEDVLSWLKGPTIVIKSTVPPSQAYDLWRNSKFPMVFNPEFLTERNWKSDIENETRVVLGGIYEDCVKVARAYQKVYGQNVAYLYTDPKTAMLTKYVSNAFLATKIAFCNETYDLCSKLGVDYDILRELWLYDKRVGRTHTLVTEKRGFGGYCLPKDLMGLIDTAEKLDYEPTLLKTVDTYNKRIRKEG